MGFNCGIVGLPNVGKSTLFNALTQTSAADCANYPFCTIEPSCAKVAVPDNRLDQIAKIAKSQNVYPSLIEFVDIAGLVKGASKGEGLGNKFLSHIRETDAIIHVARCFDDGDITHVNGIVDPISDIKTIEIELSIADLQTIEKQKENFTKMSKKVDPKTANVYKSVLDSIYKILDLNKPASEYTPQNDIEEEFVKSLHLITRKPVLYVCNVNDDAIVNGNEYTNKVAEYAKSKNAKSVNICAKIESELALLAADEKEEFIKELGIKNTGISSIIKTGYELLGLMNFFTAGPKESKSWTIKKQTTAPKAAGKIHTDFERGFICAEVIGIDDYIKYNGESESKTNGKMRIEGKEYIVADGDIIFFRFNV